MSGTRIASVSGLRGVVGDGLDPASVVEFAAAYASGCAPGPIVVGHDGRASAGPFVLAVQAAITASGRDVLHCGPVATPTLGYLVREVGASGGVQVSASHNPAEYNGLKFFQPGGMVLSPESGRDLLARLVRREFDWATWDRVGVVRPVDDPEAGHLAAVLETVDVEAIRRRRFRVLLDSSHGAGGRAGARLLRLLGAEVVHLGPQPDGIYDHPPEPTAENLRDVGPIVPATRSDVGFVQDPDADRLALFDEAGSYIGEELTLAIAARRVLSTRPGPVVLNLSTSRVVEEIARSRGCPTIRTPVGEVHVVEAIRAHSAALGGEGNGGVIDPRVGLVRDSLSGIALALDLLAAEARPLSAVVAEFPRFATVKRKYPAGRGAGLDAAMDRLVADHPEAAADRRDGLRLDWPDAWAQVRPSNTEPIVRVIAEAADAARAGEVADALGRALGGGPSS